jgi:hypothetical protein
MIAHQDDHLIGALIEIIEEFDDFGTVWATIDQVAQKDQVKGSRWRQRLGMLSHAIEQGAQKVVAAMDITYRIDAFTRISSWQWFDPDIKRMEDLGRNAASGQGPRPASMED